MSSLSGCFDVSLSRITSSARSSDKNYTYKQSGTMISGKFGVRYTYPKGVVRPFVELGADVSGMINAKTKANDKSERRRLPRLLCEHGDELQTITKE